MTSKIPQFKYIIIFLTRGKPLVAQKLQKWITITIIIIIIIIEDIYCPAYCELDKPGITESVTTEIKIKLQDTRTSCSTRQKTDAHGKTAYH